MTTLPVIRANHPLQYAVNAALAGLAPPTQKAYRAHIARFQASGSPLTRDGVKLWLQSEESRGAAASSTNQAAAALKKLASEAEKNGWIDPSAAQGIKGITGKPIRGQRTGNWLTLEQARELLALPDRNTLIGQRDAALLATLLGCGLRRAEACGLDVEQLVDGPSGLVLSNLKGKGGRVRTVGVPGWAAREIKAWLEIGQITEGKILRSMK